MEQTSLLRHPDRMGTCSAEPMQTFSPGCLLVPQDKKLVMEQWQFSQMRLSNKTAEKSFFLANHEQESRAYAGLSGEAVTLISYLLFLNTTLD